MLAGRRTKRLHLEQGSFGEANFDRLKFERV
jgi:hypothetical protein